MVEQAAVPPEQRFQEVRLSGVRKVYGRRVVLSGVDLTFLAGQITVLMGANGAGKSTLLQLLSTLRQPSAGSIFYGQHSHSEANTALRRQIGQALNMVVQVSRLNSGRRCVTHISEIGFDDASEAYRISDIFRLKSSNGELGLEWTGHTPAMADQLDLYGLREQVDLTAQMWQ